MTATPFSLSGVDWANETSIAVYYQTHAIPQRYSAGIIVASIAASILGSYATLFVLGKKTGNSGLRNIFLLILAATTMSFVGIWGMHFIGMHMRLQAGPTMNWYINFNPGFTVFSLVVPGIALIFSFLFVDQEDVGFRLWRVILAGTLTGGTVALMHYSASFYCNFNVTFQAAQTVGSILLACILCTVGLTAFFRFRAQWQDSWWKRGLCAIILGVGVSSMHYIGASGTSYRVKAEFVHNVASLAAGRKRNDILIIVIGVICFIVVVGSSFMAFSDFFGTRESRKKARKIVIASATFDRTGRLMVQSDGTLPLITVEERRLRHSEVLEALNQRSSIFQWLYTISWDWDIVLPFVDAIASKLFELEKQDQKVQQRVALTTSQKARRVLSGRYSLGNQDLLESHSSAPLLDFRDKVVDAATRLSSDLDVPLRNLGVFYDHVLPTGTRRAAEIAAAKEAYRRRLDPNYYNSRGYDDEQSIGSRAASIFGEGDDEEEGVTIFVVREVAPEQFTQLVKRGYRFTETRFLSSVLADRHGVIKEEMESILEALRVYAKRGAKPVVQPGGVYAGLFGVRPNPSTRAGGLDVLVYNFARHQIPAYRLPGVAILTEEMKYFLRSIDQMPMEGVMKNCQVASIRSSERKKTLSNYLKTQNSSDEEVQLMQLREEETSLQGMIQFQQALYISLEALHQSVRFFPSILSSARVSAEVLEVPSSLTEKSPPAQIILVQAVLPVEKAMTRTSTTFLSVPSDKPSDNCPFVFTPYTLFARAQMMMLRGQSAEEFEEEVVRDLHRRYRGKESADMMEKYSTTDDTKGSEMASEKSYHNKSGQHSANGKGGDDSKKAAGRYLSRFGGGGESKHKMNGTTVEVNQTLVSQSPYTTTPQAASVSNVNSTKNLPLSPVDMHLPQMSQSLGIRRFTAANGGAGGKSITLTLPDQTRFARPLEDQREANNQGGEGEEDNDDEEEPPHQGSAMASSDGHTPLQTSTVPHPLTIKTAPRPPLRGASKAIAIDSNVSMSFVPSFHRRPSTAQPLGSKRDEQSSPPAQQSSVFAATSSSSSRRPRTANAAGNPENVRLNFDNWQTRQLEELEKHQPNLLLGILPSEYSEY